MPLYLSRPGGKMKGMSVLRTLGKRPAQPPVSKLRGGQQAGKHTAHSNRLFLSLSNVEKWEENSLSGAAKLTIICQYDLKGLSITAAAGVINRPKAKLENQQLT